eukprot:SAG31_NODE_59_length_29571_cov_20.443506_2_plen_84_part_00
MQDKFPPKRQPPRDGDGEGCCFLVFCATIREMRDFNREKHVTNRESATLQVAERERARPGASPSAAVGGFAGRCVLSDHTIFE